MTHIIYEILAAVGLTFIVTMSKLFAPLRDLFKPGSLMHYLVRCPMCFGFWSGVIVYCIDMVGADFMLLGLSTSFVSYAAYLFIKPLIDKYDGKKDN